MKFTRIFACSVVLSASSLLGSKLFAENIASDPVLLNALAPQNWEPPNGNNFGDPSDVNGTVDTSTRNSQLSVTATPSVILGSFLIEQAAISANYSYETKFPLPQDAGLTSEKDRNGKYYGSYVADDGTQRSFYLNSMGKQIFFKTSTSDLYTFNITGNATGIYLLSGAQRQAIDAPRLGTRVADYGTGTIDNNRSGAGTSGGDAQRDGETAEVVRSVSGLVSGVAAPKIQQGWIDAGYMSVSEFNAQSPKWQYAALENFESPKNLVNQNPASF